MSPFTNRRRGTVATITLALALAWARLSTAQALTVTTFAGAPAGPPAYRGTGGVAWDSGYVYLSGYAIKRVDPRSGEIVDLAGVSDQAGSADGVGNLARFSYPYNLAPDGLGNLYVADTSNNSIRRIRIATREVTTVAGSGQPGAADGVGAAATFRYPQDVAVDHGFLYVADGYNELIRQIELSTGAVTSLAGLPGVRGAADGIGKNARFSYPAGVAADGNGNLFVADAVNCAIRRISLSTSQVTTLAGAFRVCSVVDGVGTSARFYYPTGIRYSDGSLYVTETGESAPVVGNGGTLVRRIEVATGRVTTIAGIRVVEGYRDGAGSAARFFGAAGMSPGPEGTLFIADASNYAIRQLDLPTGLVTTVAPQRIRVGSADGFGTSSRFNSPTGVVSDGRGSLYVADTRNRTIRRVDVRTHAVTTVAGAAGERGSIDGVGSAARFVWPEGLALDGSGNLYVADSNDQTIRKIELSTSSVTTVAGKAGTAGSADGVGSAARFRNPSALVWDGADRLYVSDTGSHVIRELILSTGRVSTIAGRSEISGSADGRGALARFWSPIGLALDGNGSLYVADEYNDTIRRIELASGDVTTLAGTAGISGSPLDGIGPAARFASPSGLSWDGSGLLVSEHWAIRRVDVSTRSVITLAMGGYERDGPASEARLDWVTAIAWDASTRGAFFTEWFTHDLRLLGATTGGGCVTGQGPGTLCLREGRFEASVDWKNQYASGTTGSGTARRLTSDTGAFTFFSPENVELVVKVLDGRAVNGRYWVLYGALSDVEYTLTIRDVATGASKTYRNPPGTLASVSDVDAFAPAGAPDLPGRPDGGEYGRLASFQASFTAGATAQPPTAAPSGPCATVGPDLCLNASRFLVRAAFRNYNDGAEGQGQAAALTSDTGTFWFFEPSNLELVVKVLDGRSVNGKFWVAYGALTDVEYTITVTDSAIGTSRTYHNPPHSLGSRIDVSAFP